MSFFKIFFILAFFAISTVKADVEPTLNDTQTTIVPAEITLNEPTEIKNSNASTDHKNRFTGFFLGINLGGLINQSKALIQPSGHFLENAQEEINAQTYRTHFKNGGFTGGAQIGYQYQCHYFYCGIETDFDYSSLKKTTSVTREEPSIVGTITDRVSHKINWYGTLRPKIGVVLDPVVLYVTGGLAYGHIQSHTNISYSVDYGDYNGSISKTKIGWTVGCGLGYIFAKHWFVNLDYLFIDLGKKCYLDPSPTLADYSHTTTLKNKFHDIRIGLNYLF